MKFRFVGQYTNGRDSITILGVRFDGREPSEASGETAERLARHPEFEIVEDEPEIPVIIENEIAEETPKRRGRPRRSEG